MKTARVSLCSCKACHTPARIVHAPAKALTTRLRITVHAPAKVQSRHSNWREWKGHSQIDMWQCVLVISCSAYITVISCLQLSTFQIFSTHKTPMASTPENIFFIVHYNGKVSRNQFGSFFESEQRKCFNVSIKSNIDHLKKRIEQKLHLSESQVISKIIYRAPQTIVASNIQYNDTEIFDNDDIADMFATHKYFNPVGSIELSVMIKNREIPQHRQTPQLPYTQLLSQTQYEFEPPSSSQQLPYTQLLSQTQYEFEPPSSSQ